MAKQLFMNPLALSVGHEFPPHIGADIVLCTYTPCRLAYYKFSVDGMNVVIFNLTCFFVPLALVLGWGTSEVWRHHNAVPVVAVGLCSIIPLSYYLGSAVSSISAQSTFAVGAFLNASFGSLIEVILYVLSIKKGLHELVTSAITGSLLVSMLAIPGISMIVGGLKRKDLTFNPNAAGVSCTMLILCIVGIQIPTVFYHLYSSFQLECSHCDPQAGGRENCGTCRLLSVPMNATMDSFYRDRARPVMFAAAIVMPIVYLVGLMFTLRTHSYIYSIPLPSPPSGEGTGKAGGHSAIWGKWKCLVIMVLATSVFALIAESIVDSFQDALQSLGIPLAFAGLTVVAIVPSIAEIVNAIMFSMKGNISLAMEIGNVGALQMCLIQMPLLVLFSEVIGVGDSGEGFVLILPTLNLYAIIFGVLILCYLSVDGLANYLEGTCLVAIWIILLVAFWYVPASETSVVGG
eukprot:NODE_1054_length_1598_cov_6.534538_g872_i0.p1 GENE.NODE_1054_length_1598_cov_6.534538_g872_i0~~NODE_1054_length_1598_cov_6.534538_g872_i0.p1  ORF type:complete len:461 (-),score=103.50 NODE_1054_length_1598_cov_6.534538_g872_i0:2-1384(-)